jgi:hypothetical protein
MSSCPGRRSRHAALAEQGASLTTMSSPASHSSAEGTCELTAVPAGAPGKGLPVTAAGQSCPGQALRAGGRD